VDCRVIIQIRLYNKLTATAIHGILVSMNEDEIQKELREIYTEAKRLHEKTDMEEKTALFLSAEVNKLLEKADNPDTTDEEKDQTIKELLALEKRLNREMREWNEGEVDINAIEARLSAVGKKLTDNE
jgi:translation initiation factor RLI1